MKALHTSDWHLGKKIGRFDRTAEHTAAIDEVIAIADHHEVDIVLHSGDLFDRPSPPVEALRVALDRLVRLSADGKRPVVVIAGNHDSPSLFETLAPYLVQYNVHLVGDIKRPEDGGVLDLETASGRAVVSCFPFLRSGRVTDVLAETGEWYKEYAHRLRAMSQGYASHAAKVAGQDGVTFLVSHFLVGGSKVHGHGAPRGERALHMGEAYAATPDAIPSGPQYVALGHVHAPQSVPAAKVPAEYAGSLLQLDFGEAGEDKRVVVVTVEPGLPARIESVPLAAERRLVQARGQLSELLARNDLRSAYLDLIVDTQGPDTGLAERVHQEFDFVVKVRAEYPRAAEARSDRSGKALDELFAEYVSDRDEAAVTSLVDAFRQVMEMVDAAT